MHRHLKIIVGRWKLEDWRLYRYTEHRDAKTGGKKARWMMWDRIVVADFLRGLSIVGLARKYGRTRAQIERTLRRAL
jgi:hypothetical protein